MNTNRPVPPTHRSHRVGLALLGLLTLSSCMAREARIPPEAIEEGSATTADVYAEQGEAEPVDVVAAPTSGRMMDSEVMASAPPSIRIMGKKSRATPRRVQGAPTRPQMESAGPARGLSTRGRADDDVGRVAVRP